MATSASSPTRTSSSTTLRSASTARLRCRSKATASRACASISLSSRDHHAKIVVAAALAGGNTFGGLGAVTVSIDGGLVAAATATLDAATTERTTLLAEIYRRNGSWRLRAIGQGYDDGLVELATRYGVEIEKL
jgi:acetyl-CoA carboxylase carboxyltransferase component